MSEANFKLFNLLVKKYKQKCNSHDLRPKVKGKVNFWSHFITIWTYMPNIFP